MRGGGAQCRSLLQNSGFLVWCSFSRVLSLDRRIGKKPSMKVRTEQKTPLGGLKLWKRCPSDFISDHNLGRRREWAHPAGVSCYYSTFLPSFSSRVSRVKQIVVFAWQEKSIEQFGSAEYSSVFLSLRIYTQDYSKDSRLSFWSEYVGSSQGLKARWSPFMLVPKKGGMLLNSDVIWW